ncbi:E3 ubiquitin-protein ligase RNF19A isoform X2 [Latimeria chalumnae]|uniref:E3 ubiquitin-protein ligase RNF19A isoform X2 n=1 Tax=Latimeria chalumnae TaxID=7897 RepID=UPI0006D91030|nr:PREDICTED: E3 ubiquitin-protein ligase RNF19A-like [Latimeria chalumnae]|eukprot:XP_014350299.1 PREDICTED: E3 ubiquitin-protein ligase RNF19A-like [Latimeria chalumnae]
MKRPKQHQQLSLLRFFGRRSKPKPKSEAAAEEKMQASARSREEITITLTPSGGTAVLSSSASVCSSSEQLLDNLECPLCLLSQPRSRFPELSSCLHRSCSDCLRQYLHIEIMESRVCISCPQCPEMFHPADVRLVLGDDALMDKYEEYLLRRFLVSDPDTRWCPAPDCSYAVIAYSCAECPKLTCGRNGCGTEFCYHCRQLWHPNKTCEQARLQDPQNAAAGMSDPAAFLILHEDAGQDMAEVKVCPRCGALIMKVNDGSCNRMSCAVCGCLFCWLCLKEITDVHFLSPSGCTFWGKKPWSRTRKILWQVGMLVGAPVMVSLIAGIAIPVIIVGIPIYMGRKVHSRCKKNNVSGSTQCWNVASGVVFSIFLSPIIAAITVGIGVPLMLTYIYGVVVMSLCRNGCYGRQKENKQAGTVELSNLAKRELWTGLPNPTVSENSVQEVISLPSTSRSHQDKEGMKEQDNQSASTIALAGSMLSEAQDPSYREGTNFEVQVEIEARPRAAHEPSLCSVLSVQSLSVESLGCSREQLCTSNTNSKGAASEPGAV